MDADDGVADPPKRPTIGLPGIDLALSWLRWTIVATMLLIVVAWPVPGRLGYQLWPFVVAFGAYNLLVEALRFRFPRLRSFGWVPVVDLPVAGLIYFLDAEPGGPFFVAFYLAVVTAALCWPLYRTVLYTIAVGVVIVVIAPTLPQWSPSPASFRQLAGRITILALVGIGTALLSRRLTRQAAAAQALRDETTRLEEADRLRADFLASISHDLRTPLTAARAAIGMTETSAGERLAPAEQDLLANARRNVERLGRLIDDLLAINQIEAGVLQLARAPLDLRSVVVDALAEVHPLFRERNQRVELDLAEPLPVDGDAHRLQSVIVNLLANAHRHTPPGTRIAVAGRVAGTEVGLTVEDDGPGIPVAEHDAIFRRFHRVGEGAGHGGSGGTGLGLAIARGIVELHGGSIRVESEPGGGARFHVALPLGEGDVP